MPRPRRPTRRRPTSKLRTIPYCQCRALRTIVSQYRCGRQKSRFWAYIWLFHCYAVNAATGRCCQHGRRLTTATVPQVVTRGAVTSVGWQITLCDPIDKWRPVVLRWISRRTIHSFTFFTFLLLTPAARLVCQRPSSNFPYFRTLLANFLLSRLNSVEYGNCKTTTLLPWLNVRVHSSKVELAAAGVHPVGMISSHASV